MGDFIIKTQNKNEADKMNYKCLWNTDAETIVSAFQCERVTEELVNDAYDKIVFTYRRDEKNRAFATVIKLCGLDENRLSPKVRKYVLPLCNSIDLDFEPSYSLNEVEQLKREIERLKYENEVLKERLEEYERPTKNKLIKPNTTQWLKDMQK